MRLASVPSFWCAYVLDVLAFNSIFPCMLVGNCIFNPHSRCGRGGWRTDIRGTGLQGAQKWTPYFSGHHFDSWRLWSRINGNCGMPTMAKPSICEHNLHFRREWPSCFLTRLPCPCPPKGPTLPSTQIQQLQRLDEDGGHWWLWRDGTTFDRREVSYYQKGYDISDINALCLTSRRMISVAEKTTGSRKKSKVATIVKINQNRAIADRSTAIKDEGETQ